MRPQSVDYSLSQPGANSVWTQGACSTWCAVVSASGENADTWSGRRHLPREGVGTRQSALEIAQEEFSLHSAPLFALTAQQLPITPGISRW